MVCLVAAGLCLTQTARAQTVRAPEVGGRILSLGQPLRWHWQLGLGAGAYSTGTSNDLTVRWLAGGYRSSLNPVSKLAEFGFEAYLGARGNRPDAGTRALLQVPYLSSGVGGDYNFRNGRLDLVLTVHSPVRRGGFLTRGTLLRLDWYPKRGFLAGVSAPFHDPLAGRNRPIQDYVVVAAPFESPPTHPLGNAALRAELDSLAESAAWVRRLVVPFLDQDGRSGSIALARTARYLEELRARLAQHSAEGEVTFFHAQMAHAFAVAAGSDSAGHELARAARRILLDEVLVPYDRLLGRKKHRDTLKALGVAARGRFGRWATTSGIVPGGRTEDVLYVFERLTDILETQRRQAAQEWDDPRLVWLPLQYGLLPEECNEQAELDALLERVTGVSFTEHNKLTYVSNLQFHWELLRMIRETRFYHVLWIHDFPAFKHQRTLDGASLSQVVDGYLTALAEGVAAYDSTGVLPQFFIFLDDFYYESGKSRTLMTVLEDPLRATASLPNATAADTARLSRALQRLRVAVQQSRVLQAEAREYGGAWLRNRIKVHVNITNRVDASFWSGGLVSTVFGYPDDVMRDHRKIAFRDVSEDDPFAGVGILTGLGIGQYYLGPQWDDRSLLLQGPVLLQVKQAARDLLISQGVRPEDVPAPLRAASRFPIASARTPPDASAFHSRAMALFNETGYLPKSLNAAKALLYSLMPAGSVIKVPDSLWNSTLYGGLLVGASLRGATVLIIAPALANAPSANFPQMSREHELLTRLLLVRKTLAAPIAAAGGALRTGLYALPVDEHGFASRADRWAQQVNRTPFLTQLYPFAPGLMSLVAEAGRPPAIPATHDPSDSTAAPKLHQKVQFLATAEFWRGITTSPEWSRFMQTYLSYREATYTRGETEHPDARALTDSLERIAIRLLGSIQSDPRAASYALVGSQNQDYRGMFMDGEAAVVFTGATSLVPLVDLVFMVGTVTWIEDEATLDRLLPPVSELQRRIARMTKDGV